MPGPRGCPGMPGDQPRPTGAMGPLLGICPVHLDRPGQWGRRGFDRLRSCWTSGTLGGIQIFTGPREPQAPPVFRDLGHTGSDWCYQVHRASRGPQSIPWGPAGLRGCHRHLPPPPSGALGATGALLGGPAGAMGIQGPAGPGAARPGEASGPHRTHLPGQQTASYRHWGDKGTGWTYRGYCLALWGLQGPVVAGLPDQTARNSQELYHRTLQLTSSRLPGPLA